MRIKQGISPVAVANYLLEKDLRDKRPTLTRVKLLYLVYQCHGRYMAKYNAPLVNELVEAWSFGAVFPSIYEQVKDLGPDSLTKLLDDGSGDQLTAKQKQLADEVYEDYRQFDGVELMEREIDGKTPWAEVFIEQDREYFPISNKLIKAYHKEMLDAQYV
ncbi:MAG: DUF4065 domain-containing protein [Proteobacteria bacterium]|nr:DUF4065 domain-containing protein [Pseudomonadota bacterium]